MPYCDVHGILIFAGAFAWMRYEPDKKFPGLFISKLQIWQLWHWNSKHKDHTLIRRSFAPLHFPQTPFCGASLHLVFLFPLPERHTRPLKISDCTHRSGQYEGRRGQMTKAEDVLSRQTLCKYAQSRQRYYEVNCPSPAPMPCGGGKADGGSGRNEGYGAWQRVLDTVYICRRSSHVVNQVTPPSWQWRGRGSSSFSPSCQNINMQHNRHMGERTCPPQTRCKTLFPVPHT